MNAPDFLAGKLRFYEQTFCGGYLRRIQPLTTTVPGQPIEFDRVIQELDPGILKAEFEAALRAIARDFAQAYNECLSRAAKKDRGAAALFEEFAMRAEHYTALEQQLRQALPPLYGALGELANSRASYSNFRSIKTSRALSTGAAAGGAGRAIGDMILPGLGGVVGGVIAFWLANAGIDKQHHQLLQDCAARLDAVTSAVQSTWSVISDTLQYRFRDFFGTRLRQFALQARQRQQRSQLAGGASMLLAAPNQGQGAARLRRWLVAVVAVSIAALAATGTWLVLRHSPESRGIHPAGATASSETGGQ